MMPKNAFFVRSQHDPKLIFHQLRRLVRTNTRFWLFAAGYTNYFEVARILNFKLLWGVFRIRDRNLYFFLLLSVKMLEKLIPRNLFTTTWRVIRTGPLRKPSFTISWLETINCLFSFSQTCYLSLSWPLRGFRVKFLSAKRNKKLAARELSRIKFIAFSDFN